MSKVFTRNGGQRVVNGRAALPAHMVVARVVAVACFVYLIFGPLVGR